MMMTTNKQGRLKCYCQLTFALLLSSSKMFSNFRSRWQILCWTEKIFFLN